jgi:HK97 family phage portal protein
VYACTRLQAGAVATLPLPIYEHDENGDRTALPKDPVHRLLNVEPTARFTAATWLEYVVSSMLLRGDAFTQIRRSRNGTPGELIPMPSQAVIVEKKDNRLRYYWDDEGKRQGFDQDDVLHFPGFGFNGLRSLSVIRYAAYNAIGTGIAMEEFAGKFFVNGAMQKIVLENPNEMDSGQIEKLQEIFAHVECAQTDGGLRRPKGRSGVNDAGRYAADGRAPLRC